MKIIIFLFGILLGIGIGWGISNTIRFKKEPTVGELCSASDGERSYLYLELLNDESLEIAQNSKAVRLIVHQSLHTHQ